MIIVGSSSAYYQGLTNAYPKDLDVFYPESFTGTKLKGDVHTIPDNIYKILQESSTEGFISKDDLYTLKCSHLQWDIKWDKTKSDVLLYKHLGCELNEDLYDCLVEWWKKEHGDKSFLSLDKDKETFFNDHVVYKYDHDFLHEVCAEGLGLDQPTYQKCLKDGASIMIDNNKVRQLSFEEQISMFRQEVAVIAFERWLVYGKTSWVKAHSLSLKKTITNLTKGESSDFLVKHLEHFVKPDYTYYSNLLKLLEEN